MMTKKLYIIIAIVIVVALVGWWWSSRQAVQTPFDTSNINQELEDLDVGDINTEFKQIDQELDTL